MFEREITMMVNGEPRTAEVEDRRTLAEFLREECGLTGTHLACEHGVCGACTVLLDGDAVRSCLLFAAQAEGTDVTTIEGLSPDDGSLTRSNRPSPTITASSAASARPASSCPSPRSCANPSPDDDEIRHGLSGNLCRCTGYQGIVAAVKAVAGR